MAVWIDETKCAGCGSCVDACSLEAVAVIDGMAGSVPSRALNAAFVWMRVRPRRFCFFNRLKDN
jgi:Fe-S-cluster-containing hydrogenase component 2